MSIFRTVTLACPACDTPVDFEAVHSVNADSRPDLRADILAQQFQQEACPTCGAKFRLDPEFNLLDTQRGQWIAAAPLAGMRHWKAAEERAEALFARAFGEDAPESAQVIGQRLHPRITFGWPALREKLLARDHDLDDVTLELCKAFIMRNVDSPISAATELRLVSAEGDGLGFAWLLAEDGSPGPTMTVGRALYEEIATDEDGAWADLREAVSAGYFVDINRLMMDESPQA